MSDSQMQVEGKKDVLTAVMLAVLFGPIGLLYASIGGGIAMLILGVLAAKFSMFALAYVELVSVAWALLAALGTDKQFYADVCANNMSAALGCFSGAVSTCQADLVSPGAAQKANE